MASFLIDGDRQFDYGQLLSGVKQSSYYCRYFKTDSLYAYFENLVKALVANRPVTLIDSDISADEIDGLPFDKINEPTDIDLSGIESIDNMIERVKDSKSDITIFTSGTTGQPKKVVHNVATLTRNLRAGAKYESNVWGYAYNPTHIAGLQVFFQAFENKNTIVNIFRKTRSEIYEAIPKNGITHISATPTFYRMLLPYEHSFNEVHRITLGGEKSDKLLFNQLDKIFPNAKINNVYASTEAGSLLATKDDCFFIPSQLKQYFKITNGELLIHKSLLGTSDSFIFDNDFYHSGDLIEWIDPNAGIFKFASRKNELINVGGYKVNPGEIETVIMQIEGVLNTSVYGKTNSVLGNVLCADVVKQTGYDLTDIDIKLKLREQLQDFKIPRRIKFVDALPTTRTGKIQR